MYDFSGKINEHANMQARLEMLEDELAASTRALFDAIHERLSALQEDATAAKLPKAVPAGRTFAARGELLSVLDGVESGLFVTSGRCTSNLHARKDGDCYVIGGRTGSSSGGSEVSARIPCWMLDGELDEAKSRFADIHAAAEAENEESLELDR